MAIQKAGARPLAELAAFLEPFGKLLYRKENRYALERYATGLLSDVGRKTASGMGRALPGTNGQRLLEFLTGTDWEAGEMDRLRCGHMLQHASCARNHGEQPAERPGREIHAALLPMAIDISDYSGEAGTEAYEVMVYLKEPERWADHAP